MDKQEVVKKEEDEMNLLAEKSQLAERKLELQNECALLKSQMHSRRHSNSEWQKLMSKKNEKQAEINHLESRLINIKQLLREEAMGNKTMIGADKPDDKSKSLMAEIIALRNEYELFGADGTRVASMRRMASEFAVKLTRLIKHN